MNVAIEGGRRKSREVRDDGYIFIGYRKRNGRISEHWLSPEAFKKAAESNKRWKEENKDRHRAHSRRSVGKWRAYHPEKYANSRSSYTAKNIDKIRERARARRASIKEAGGEKYKRLLERSRYLNRRWVANNPDKHTERAIRRRVRYKASLPPMTQSERALVRIIYKWCRRVTKCTGITHHVDHIIPLARGGAHCPTNLQVLPAVINLRKGTKIPDLSQI